MPSHLITPAVIRTLNPLCDPVTGRLISREPKTGEKVSPLYEGGQAREGYLADDYEDTLYNFLKFSQVPAKDRMWVVLHEDMLEDHLFRKFAVKCVEGYAEGGKELPDTLALALSMASDFSFYTEKEIESMVEDLILDIVLIHEKKNLPGPCFWALNAKISIMAAAKACLYPAGVTAAQRASHYCRDYMLSLARQYKIKGLSEGEASELLYQEEVDILLGVLDEAIQVQEAF